MNKQSGLSFPIALTALVLGAIAMGISPAFVRFADVGAFASAFYRVALAVPFLVVWAFFENRRTDETARGDNFLTWITPNQAVLLSGIFFAGDLFFWHLAILNTSIANATFLACLAPVWVLLFSGAFIGEPVTRAAMMGLLLCIIGATLLVGVNLSAENDRWIGDLYGIATSLFFGLYILAIRVARRSQGAGIVTLQSTIVTAIVLLLVTLIAGQSLMPTTFTGILALLGLGLLAHIGGQGLLAVALGSLSAAFSSLVIFIEALTAALFAWLIFNETLSPGQIGGGCLILLGIWVARPRSAR